jgi:uncharacterized protein (TIGR02996 family)
VTGYSDDELYADLLEVIEQMVETGELELATRKDQDALAAKLTGQVRGARREGLADWFVDQRGVSELYLDDDELAKRFAKVFARLAGEEPTAQWNEELAARIREAPDDVSARVVFGDWLEQAGDPRGELVQLQARLAATPDDTTLRRREQRFVTRHRGHLLGPLADDEDTRVAFAYGFVDTLVTSAEVYLAAHAHPSLAFVREVRLHGRSAELELAVAQLPPRLHSLGLRCDPLAAPVVLDGLTFPDLRVLDVRDPKLDAQDGWRRAFPQLADVRFAFPGARSVPAVLAHLFEAPPATLRRLRMVGRWAATGLLRLVDAPLLAQLTEIDVDDAVFSDGELERHAAKLAHLQRLDLRGTNVYYLSGLDHILVTGNRPGQVIERDRYPDVYDDEDDEDEDEEEIDDEEQDAEADEPESEDEDDDGAPPEVEFDD